MRKSSHACSCSPSNASAITDHIAPCVYWPPFSRIPGGYPLMYPGSISLRSNGGAKSRIKPASRSTSSVDTDAIAWRALSGCPPPLMTAQLWLSVSIRHSAFEA